MKSPLSSLLALLLALAPLSRVQAAEATGQSAPAPASAPASASTAAVDPALIPPDEQLPGTGPMRRAPWFQNIWTERRTAWASQVQKDQGALVFLGDSITQGWRDVGSFFPGTRIANRGISGDTTRGVLYRLKDDVLSLKPRGVVLLIGTNDLEEKAEPETIASNLRLILAALREHNPAMPVILCSVLPSSSTMRRPADSIRKINTLYRAVAEAEPQVSYIDTWSAFADVQGDARLEDMPDLLHPNAVGYARFAAVLRPLFESLGLVPSWPDDFVPEAGFVSLFNGRDLSGWQYKDGPALKGAVSTPDGRFAVRNGRLVAVLSKVERQYRKLWTVAEFPKDFELRLEFRASPNADSGVYLRGPQLQCRDYPVAGPFALLRAYRSNDWNELVITVRGGLAHATCNGEILVDAMEVPATGPIGLESDRGQMEYRRIRIRSK
jgi:lysophospholipase L1-like esterase